jgi:hypothetical protein
MWKAAVIAYFNVIFLNYPGGTEETHFTRWTMFRPGTSRVPISHVTTKQTWSANIKQPRLQGANTLLKAMWIVYQLRLITKVDCISNVRLA